MLWNTLIELDTLFSILFIIVYALYSLRSQQILLSDTYLLIRLLPLFWYVSNNMNTFTTDTHTSLFEDISGGIELLLSICVIVIMYSFSASNSIEACILVLLAYIFQYYMLHSTDLLSFFITLEAQNFCFFILCGVLPFTYSNKHNLSSSIEIGLKYLLLSAFSSGILLYGTSLLYIQTGSIDINTLTQYLDTQINMNATSGTVFVTYIILCSILFKLGVAPFHLWMYQIYSGTHRSLLLYITTIPKLCIIAFWIIHLQGIINNYTLLLFSILSGFIGSTAYTQPNIRNLLVYSSISEIGLLIAALDTAGYNALLQHLTIYIISQFLLWNINNTSNSNQIHHNRIMSLLAISVAGMPPLLGFYGKAWIFWHLTTLNTASSITLLLSCLVFAFISIVFYIRLIRLSWSSLPSNATTSLNTGNNNTLTKQYRIRSAYAVNNGVGMYNNTIPFFGVISTFNTRVLLTSTCLIMLIVLPFFVMKPF